MSEPPIDLAQLRLFVAVSRHGSFASAARALDRDPSLISRGIAALEGALGVTLFHRSTRRMALTESGLRFSAEATRIITELDAAVGAARQADARPTGSLRITASAAFGERVLSPLIPAFRAAYPGVSLDLLWTDTALDLLAETVDLALRLGARPSGPGVAARLRAVSYAVVATPAYWADAPPLETPADLAAHSCLLYARPGLRDAWRFRSSITAETRQPVAGALAFSAPLGLRAAALSGLGPALLADWLVAEDLAAGRLVRRLDGWDAALSGFDSGIWALMPSAAHRPAKLTAMLDFLRARLPRSDHSAATADGPSGAAS